MIIYKDIKTGEEMFSDAFDVKLVDDMVYEVQCTMITIKQGVDVDIGANPSSEEQEEALEEGTTQVNDVAYSFKLQTSPFDKKSYKTYLKSYLKSIKIELGKTNPDRVAAFEAGAKNYFNKITNDFDNYECYTSEAADVAAEGMVALLNYREDGITPFFTFWKDGLKEEKQ